MQIGRKNTEIEYQGFSSTMKTIFQNEGWRGFYNGVTASAVKCLGPGFLLIFNEKVTSSKNKEY